MATFIAAPGVADAQVPVRGRVVGAENDQPLAGAAISALAARRVAQTDRHGRFVIWLVRVPDTLVARFIGRTPDSVVVMDTTPGELVLRLVSSPLPIAGVLVAADASRRAEDAAAPSTWSLPREAVGAVPSAVEADVLRGLALSPAVAYATPLSAQPFIRGADPGAVGYRLDGFTLINPFHLGRIFGAIMPEAVQAATLQAAPFGEELGDATSGVVDAQLREGGERLEGGAQGSFVSLAAWAGGPAGRHRWFAAWRHGYYEHLPGPFREVPYRLNDVYVRLALLPGDRVPLYLTGFLSGDRLFHRETGDGVRWGNTLLGLRLPLAFGRAGQMELWGETSRFYEDVVNLPIRGFETDVVNRFSTTAAGTRVQWTASSSALAVSGELRHRRLRNRISGGDLSAPSSDAAGLVGAGYASLAHRAGPVALRIGLRLDADRVVRAWQPRLRLGVDLGRRWSLGGAAGRTTKLYHVLAERLPEIDDVLSVYDLWRPAGRSGMPISTADHALVELKRAAPGLLLRASAFASRIQGAGEVRERAEDTSAAAFFRFGRGRVWGVDAELNATGRRASAVLSYVLSWSRRTWDDPHSAEVPWRFDRRHQGRLFVTWHAGRGWRFSGLGELLSPEPMTPARGSLLQAVLTPSGARRLPFSSPYLVLGQENAARGGWMGHVDLGIRKDVGGPGRSEGRLGISILNVSFTRVMPAVPRIEFDDALGASRVLYKPRFFLPPIPTLTFRLEF